MSRREVESKKITIKREDRGKEYEKDLLEAILDTLEEILEALRK